MNEKNDISFELLESDEVSTSESSEETEKDTVLTYRNCISNFGWKLFSNVFKRQCQIRWI